VLDMYRLLARTPSRVVLAAPADAVADRRQPNLPGTQDEYPNWRLPLADATGAEIPLETFLTAPGTTAITDVLRAPRPR
jgi:4-alpha-glucanotransferase